MLNRGWNFFVLIYMEKYACYMHTDDVSYPTCRIIEILRGEGQEMILDSYLRNHVQVMPLSSLLIYGAGYL